MRLFSGNQGLFKKSARTIHEVMELQVPELREALEQVALAIDTLTVNQLNRKNLASKGI